MGDALEQLLFGFSWDGRDRFVMVTDVPTRLRSSRRALARFVFEQVHDFQRVPGTLGHSGNVSEYRLESEGRPFVVQWAKMGSARIEIGFGSELGGVSFRSKPPSVEVLRLDAAQAGDQWRYFLHGTDEEIDLFGVFDAWR